MTPMFGVANHLYLSLVIPPWCRSCFLSRTCWHKVCSEMGHREVHELPLPSDRHPACPVVTLCCKVLEKQRDTFQPGVTSLKTRSVSPAETYTLGPPLLVSQVPSRGLLFCKMGRVMLHSQARPGQSLSWQVQPYLGSPACLPPFNIPQIQPLEVWPPLCLGAARQVLRQNTRTLNVIFTIPV